MRTTLDTTPELVNELDFGLGVSMFNADGVSDYGLKFYFMNWEGTYAEEMDINTTEGFKVHKINEQDVVFEHRLKFHSLHFKTDEHGEISCSHSECQGPDDDWSIDDWINYVSKDFTVTDEWKARWRNYFVSEEVFAKYAIDMLRMKGEKTFNQLPQEEPMEVQ